MSNSKLPYISVIIIAYKRKEFLLNAIKSVVNQTLETKYYQIIVIKNFTDNTIDNYIKNKKVIGIVSSEESLTGKLVEALDIAKGHIISFLEDDDLFSNDKLEIVYNKFKDNDNLCYYHNDNISINEKYQKLNIDRGNSIAINMSSISVRKSILDLNKLKKIDFCVDDYVYLSALESDKNIIGGKEKLTYYMFHNSSSNSNTEDINEFITFKLAINEHVIKTFKIFSKIFISNKANDYINQVVTFMEISTYIYGGTIKPRNSFNIFKNRDMSLPSRFKIFLGYLLVRFHGNFRYILIKKFLNNNRKI